MPISVTKIQKCSLLRFSFRLSDSLNSSHHVIEDRVKDLPSLLRVSLGQHLHRPLQVSEQHRDLLSIDGPSFASLTIGLRCGRWTLRADEGQLVVPGWVFGSLEDGYLTGQTSRSLRSGGPHQAAVFFHNTRRTQFISSLIESWLSNAEQT